MRIFHLLRTTDGAVSAEYALIITAIGMTVASAAIALGAAAAQAFTRIATCISAGVC